jgi:hypothetical protein
MHILSETGISHSDLAEVSDLAEYVSVSNDKQLLIFSEGISSLHFEGSVRKRRHYEDRRNRLHESVSNYQ